MSDEKGVAGPRLHHVPGLDGIRALAVLAVIAFHNGFSWLPGGFYGVDAFFVLSGFLITSLLVTEWRGTGGVALGRFWVRRARRLLPALYVLVTAIGVVVIFWPAVFGTTHLLAGALASLFYSANWYFIAAKTNYFATSAQSPFLHTWSLAIEEQFYLVWPLVVLTVLRGWRRRPGAVRRVRGAHAPRAASAAVGPVATLNDDQPEVVVQVVGRPGASLSIMAGPVTSDPEARTDGNAERARRLEVLFAIAAFGALASSLLMAFLAPSGGNPNRAYYGTDTRAQAILVGAAVAVAFARWGPVAGARARRRAAALAVVGALGTAALWGLVSFSSSLAFRGGFLLAAFAAAAVVAGAVVAPQGPVTWLLCRPPLLWLGKISYGVYLWYWPVLLVMTGQRVHLGVYPLFVARVAVTVIIAAVSYRFIEQPIRLGAFPSWRGLVAVPVGAGLAVVAMAVAAVAPLASTAAVAPAPAPPVTQPAPGSVTTTVPSAGRPVRVLLVGDSAGGSLGVGLGQDAPHYGVQLFNEGQPGCSVSMDQQIRILGADFPPGPPCQLGDPDALLAQWQRWVDEFDPDVVIYLARGELFDQEHGGVWVNLGESSMDSYVSQRFGRAIAVLGSHGAAVALMTSPYYDSGDQPVGTPWPEDDPARVSIDNQIMRAVVRSDSSAAATTTSSSTPAPPPATSVPSGPGTTVTTVMTPAGPSTVALIDFGTLVSPGGHYSQYVDNVDVRCNDGVHFTAVGGEFLGAQLLPEIVRLGQAHQQADPQPAYRGSLPPTTPAWYAKLPCG